jgi:hypothetical protein
VRRPAGEALEKDDAQQARMLERNMTHLIICGPQEVNWALEVSGRKKDHGSRVRVKRRES